MRCTKHLTHLAVALVLGVLVASPAYAIGSLTEYASPTTALGGTNTAATPSRVEGSPGSWSFDLFGNARITMGTLLAGEDQTNGLIRTSGGAVRTVTLMTGVTTNTTSAATTIFSGGKTPIGQVSGTGAVTATLKLYGDNDSTPGPDNILLCTITLSDTTKDTDKCLQFTDDYPYYYAVSSNVTGTGATVEFVVAVGAAGGSGTGGGGAVTNAGTFAVQADVTKINSVTPLMGAGNTGTGSQRVTEATDSQLSAGVGATGDSAATVGSTGSLTAKGRLMTTQLDAIQTAVQLIDDDQTGGTTCMLISTAATNSTNCKASAGRVLAIRAVNTTSTLAYVRMYNASSAPTCSSATGFVESIPIPHGTGTGNGISTTNGPAGQAYSTGIGFCITGGGSSTDNTNAVAAVYLTIIYK